jgi:hypothetical protein
MTAGMYLPEVVSPEEWFSARKHLLVKEKEATRARDRVNADRRLPMVRIDGADGWNLVAGVPLHRPRTVPPCVPDITAWFALCTSPAERRSACDQSKLPK